VDNTIAGTRDAKVKAQLAADTFATIFTALSLLTGAFVAMAAAAYGNKVRDEY
jgi:hypothetical protein